MAKLKNTHRLFDLKHGESVMVGHNREMVRALAQGSATFLGYLHGHNIFVAEVCGRDSSVLRITLNPRGYRTATTRAAMGDFARALGGSLSVSFAKGEFSCRYTRLDGRVMEKTADSSGVIRLTAGRYL